MVQIFRLRRSSLRRKIPFATISGLFVTIFAIGLSLGTTSGAPLFSSPVTAAQSRLYYDANVRIRKDGLAFLVGVKAEWLGLTVLNNGTSYTDSVNIGNGDTNGDKYPWLAFSPVDGTGYVAWNSITAGSGRSYETYVRVIPPAYNGVSNTTLGPAKRIFDITGYQLAQPSIGVDATGTIYLAGYGVTNPVSLILFKFDSNFNQLGSPQILDQQPAGARSEMDTQMCIDSASNIHITSFFPYGTDSTSPPRLYAWSKVSPSTSFVKTDITPTGWTLKKGRQGKDIACAPDGSVYVAINNNGRYDMFKRDAGAGGSEKWHQVQSTLFGTSYATSVGVGTSLDGRVWATQGDGATSPSDPNPIIGTNVKYSTDGGITFSTNERAIPTSAYQNMSVAVDGNGPGGKVHLVGSFYFTSGDFSVTTQYAWATTIVNLPPPTNLVATAVSQTQINLSWTGTNPPADQYQILRATSPGGPYTQINTTTNTTYQDTGLTYGTTYYYQVTATKSGYNASSPSNIAVATTYGPVGIVFVAQPGSGVAGASISPAPTVRVVDQGGSTVTGYNGTVTFSLAPGTGTPGANLGGTTTQNIVNGVSTFTGSPLTIDSVGSGYQLKAVAGSFANLSNTFNQTGTLVVSAPSITETVPFTITVTVQKNSGTDTNYNGPVSLSFTGAGGAYYYGLTTTFAASGVATFTNQMIDTQSPTNSFSPSLPGGLGSGTSGNFVVAPYGGDPALPTDCTRILLSSATSICNVNPNSLATAFTLAGSKPVYVDHKALGSGIYTLPAQTPPVPTITIPTGAWLDAGCSSANGPGMQINLSPSTTFGIQAGGNTFLRGLYLTGTNTGNPLFRVQNNQTGNIITCSKVGVAS